MFMSRAKVVGLGVEATHREAERTDKVWGHELTFSNGQYSLKALFIEWDRQTSWHRHREKAETLLCVCGTGVVFHHDGANVGGIQYAELLPGVAVEIPPGHWHRIVNTGISTLILHEAGTPHREEDTERREQGGRRSKESDLSVV